MIDSRTHISVAEACEDFQVIGPDLAFLYMFFFSLLVTLDIVFVLVMENLKAIWQKLANLPFGFQC